MKKKKPNIYKELFGSINFTKLTEILLREARQNTSKFDKKIWQNRLLTQYQHSNVTTL